MKDLFRIEIDMEQKMCSICKKSSSEYWNLQSQIRFRFYDDIMKMKELVHNRLVDTFNSINKLEEVDNGFDAYFRTSGDMNKVSSLFSDFLTIEKRSKKLMGRDQLVSKDLYRYYQSLTLININRGDKVNIKGTEYIIKAINKGGVLVLINQINSNKEVLKYSIIEDYLKLIAKAGTF